MQGTIASFRRGRKTQTMNQLVIIVPDVATRDAATALVGKEVVWTTPGKEKKELKGKISSAHGGNGAVRALFETGMPGQSIGTKIEIR